MDDFASQAEVASSRGEQGKVYKITKVVFSKFCGLTDALVGDKEGGLPISEEIDDHWAEHFSEALDRLLPTAQVDNKEAGHDLDVNTAPPEREEIISAIKFP